MESVWINKSSGAMTGLTGACISFLFVQFIVICEFGI